ncbi:ABC transporter ATP-binding protein [Acaryochloris marina]|uniref:Sugar ABC transporter, ATP-binding protein n=1 Tax=Acaryochloris marina (strain MBIC 11017) TaxID=329726 RepID=B0C7W5_ACAM1|nr:ABC transporter ATP-binding protein [Acaryochloris marina]ABW26506.1 sugar ABC transporter, ATP-binding protein [Acaryochloris marina MBIC11017]BDM81316.1 glycerol-3-phosphate ABC transporter ATP-binding protein [Acaryochloris marina MBIC10699]
MAKLEIKHLNKTYNPKVVPVKDLSLTVEDGEFLTLLGPSGCGKSTTLRLIAGLEQPTRGDVVIGPDVVTHKSAGDRDIAMVFQSYALYPHMNVYDNIASGLKLRKMSSTDIQQRVAEASRVLNLDDLMRRKPGQLSGGQRQRVALGRALVRNPAVFLLDEPLSNLDALLREQVRAELKQLFEKQNAPVVYVTHDQTEAMTLSSKVAVLYQGDLQQLDPPQQIYSRPANQFVAGFIGSPQMNLLTLRCENQSAILGETRIPLPSSAVSPREIVLGIRPEHTRLTTPGDSTTITGQVYLVENLGMSNLLSIKVQGGEETIRALLPTDQTWSGETISVALPSNQLHWFDVQSQMRLE